MGLYFKILRSSDENMWDKELRAKSGTLIGRTKGHWIIEDNRISSTHAEIQENNQGDLFLIDKDSRNGIEVEGKKLAKLLLLPGTIFQLGNTIIEVFHKDNLAPIFDHEALDLEKKISKIHSLLLKAQPDLTFCKPQFFKTPLRLQVIQGLQLDQKWSIEFGPFKFGSGCVGGLLAGNGMPLEVFEISLGSQGPTVAPLTQKPILKLNSSSLKKGVPLKTNDILSVHLPKENVTRIKVQF